MMRRTMLHRCLGLVVGMSCGLSGFSARADEPDSVRFRPVDVFVDTGTHALAAFQVEIVVESGDAQIVGVEGGEHIAFRRPPYYDPKALMTGRIILAAFTTHEDLPRGRVRLFTLHLREVGVDPIYRVRRVIAADAEAHPIDVSLRLEDRKTAR